MLKNLVAYIEHHPFKTEATITDSRLMREAVVQKPGIKASAGIKTADKIRKMIKAGTVRIGISFGIVIINREDAGTVPLA